MYNINAKDIAVGRGGALKVASLSGAVFTQTDIGFQENYNLDGAERIGVDGNGFAWVVRGDGRVFQQVDSGSGWAEIFNILASDISFGPISGTPLAIGNDGKVLSLKASGWEESYNVGSATRIAVDNEDFAWVITGTEGTICRQVDYDSGWAGGYGMARDIAFGPDGKPWIVGVDGSISVLMDNGWQNMGTIGGPAISLAVDENNIVYATREDGAIFTYPYQQ